ncbi:5-formyltetrahydrofolate cyclo-ligase [Pseudohoeflea coraliihabitans]|uniref:5-formyltetrahydrofolate cyclo-ligase n=1 Tax=Pseudohoeflea coraliihabitans TaxID=2860393 RepID=A0ABS6WK38_9HYPH|nr:5-formyltetrahydrofolate cyclo-ligase [Pseudohoeflea sp. DP4N28-3]MBW3096313.1 5-formyltetrahydrofolate cyclo-ligase [Pseudohoeflea sp. DP4N28-3]
MLDKQSLRRAVLDRRDRLPVQSRIEKSLAMEGHAAALQIAPGTLVAGFLPIRSEPDLRPLLVRLRECGARLCLPVVVDRQTIVFRAFDRDTGLVETGFGTRGPADDAAVVSPDVILLPLAAFDRRGHRLGYGAGHYDRAIARLRAEGRSVRLVGAAFDMQETDLIAAEAHDVPLDEVLTESGLRRFAAGEQ